MSTDDHVFFRSSSWWGHGGPGIVAVVPRQLPSSFVSGPISRCVALTLPLTMGGLGGRCWRFAAESESAYASRPRPSALPGILSLVVATHVYSAEQQVAWVRLFDKVNRDALNHGRCFGN